MKWINTLKRYDLPNQTKEIENVNNLVSVYNIYNKAVNVTGDPKYSPK